MSPARRLLAGLLIIGAAAVAATLAVALTTSPPAPAASASASSEPAVFVGAGDIAECDFPDDEATAEILDEVVEEHPDAVVYTTGDNAYPSGTYDDLVRCYDPSWGRHKERTRPVVGNHDFGERQGAGHYRYWGEAGGPFDRYYYSYDVGTWHVIVLNSECHRVGCRLDDPDGDQVEWLLDDLASTDAECTVALWHNPRWSSGRYGNDPEYDTFWEILYEHGVEIVLNGHEHLYERFAPLDPSGAEDPSGGIRQFTVGTGGGNLRGFDEDDVQPGSEARGSAHGVLAFELGDGEYSWEFLAVDGDEFTDSGSDVCH